MTADLGLLRARTHIIGVMDHLRRQPEQASLDGFERFELFSVDRWNIRWNIDFCVSHEGFLSRYFSQQGVPR